jgi:Protein of unknown function (DUF3995)
MLGWMAPTRPSATNAPASAVAAASAALLLGVLYAAVSAYWGCGGTALLNTVGGAFERAGRTGSAGLIALLWVTVLLKLLAGILGRLAVVGHRKLGTQHRRLVRRAAWAAALILVMYGGVLSVIGWLVQLDIVSAGSHADHKALRWHAYLWDPWFLVWGLLLAIGLALSRPRRTGRVSA